MLIKKYSLGHIQTNSFLLCCETQKKAAIVDPGDKSSQIIDFLYKEGYELLYIINTHGHFDHIGGNLFFSEKTKAPIAAHKEEYALITSGGGASFFGIPSEESPQPAIDLSEMDKISVGGITLDIIYTPGHTPGHISLYHKESASLFCGDVLFHRSIGRTDTPGGNHKLLLKSIREKLFTLPDETIVYSGHGPETRIIEEKRENPWVAF
ncbi:MAG: MBL fold metallo-hydrolase [Spirochaetes bacterium]|nr:MBL fold metallo-hydrolase [Spirochaetota bacterium]